MSANEIKKVRLSVTHGQDLTFDGRVLHEFTTQNAAGSKERWSELRLWETNGGNLIAEKVGCSTRHGDIAIRAARQISGPLDAMDLWEWSSAGKAFARELGWDIIQRID